MITTSFAVLVYKSSHSDVSNLPYLNAKTEDSMSEKGHDLASPKVFTKQKEIPWISLASCSRRANTLSQVSPKIKSQVL